MCRYCAEKLACFNIFELLFMFLLLQTCKMPLPDRCIVLTRHDLQQDMQFMQFPSLKDL